MFWLCRVAGCWPDHSDMYNYAARTDNRKQFLHKVITFSRLKRLLTQNDTIAPVKILTHRTIRETGGVKQGHNSGPLRRPDFHHQPAARIQM